MVRDDILGFALAELDVPIEFCHLSDLDRFTIVTSDRYRRELAFKPLLSPGTDVLVLPVPVGSAVRHGLNSGHIRGRVAGWGLVCQEGPRMGGGTKRELRESK